MDHGEHDEHHDEKEHKKHKEHEERKEKEHREDHKYKKEHKEHEEHGKKYEEKEKGRKEMGYGEEKGEGYKLGDGFHMKKRDLWLVAGGALGALAALGLGKISGKIRPAAVGTVREGYAFKEWLAGKAEKVKEDMEDIYAEGVHQYHSNVAATSDSVKRERDILEKLDKMIDAKLAKMRPEPGEGE